MKQHAIHWFELYTTDLDRAAKFYETILQTPLATTGQEGCNMRIFPYDPEHGVGGSLTKMDGCTPGIGGTIIYLNGEGDLDGILARVPEAGGKVIKDRFPIPPHGFIGLIEDTEGNVVGIHSMS